jgi:kynureninase
MTFDRDACRRLDKEDPLRALRTRFVLPREGIYLAANSLGPMPVGAPERLAEASTHAWGEGVVRSWSTAGWFDLPRSLGAKLAPILGAAPEDVLVTDTISLNLYKLVTAMCARWPERPRVVVEASAFPSDRYIVASAAAHTIDLASPADLDAALEDPSVGLLVLGHVDYVSSFRWDVASTTAKIHRAGARVIWDLAHSAGVMELSLREWAVDAAVGCTYKYLSGGPGAPGFLYVDPAVADDLVQPLAGWWGHAAPFAMASAYAPAPGIARFLCGTQPVLSMVALEAALAAVADVDWRLVRAKSERLTAIFIAEIDALARRHAIRVVGPREASLRGSHVSVDIDAGYEVVQALLARGIVGDFRPPRFARFGLSPIITTHEEAWLAASALGDVLDTGIWREPRFAVRRSVT